MKSATPAIAALRRAGVAHRVHGYDHDRRATAYGEEAAERLGVDPARVLKTLVLDAGGLVVAVVPVTMQVDEKAVAAACGVKRAALAPVDVAERTTGYVVGGISPIGQRRPHPTIVDRTAMEHATVFVSAGRRGLEIELSPADLVAQTSARLDEIARP